MNKNKSDVIRTARAINIFKYYYERRGLIILIRSFDETSKFRMKIIRRTRTENTLLSKISYQTIHVYFATSRVSCEVVRVK